MGVSCRIYIMRPSEGVHRAGEPLRGILSYAIDEPTEYRTAVLSLIGTAKCKWTEGSGKHKTTYKGRENFLTFHLNILNKQTKKVVLPVGTYEFPFEFNVPDELPSSFKDKYSQIKYQLKARFEKPSFFSFARKFEKQVIVYGNVDTTAVEPLTYGLQKKLFKPFSATEQMVDLNVTVSKSVLIPGEIATLVLSVTNDSDTKVYVTMELCCRSTYIAKGSFFGNRTKVSDKTVPGCSSVTSPVSAYTTENFSCAVPTLPHLYTIQHCKIISKEYYILVSLNLPFPHINKTCVIPIVIGEGSGNCSGVEAMEDNCDSGLQPSTSDPPPSYWEVMNEDKTPDGIENTHDEK